VPIIHWKEFSFVNPARGVTSVNQYDEQFIVDLKLIALLICLQVFRNVLITAA